MDDSTSVVVLPFSGTAVDSTRDCCDNSRRIRLHCWAQMVFFVQRRPRKFHTHMAQLSKISQTAIFFRTWMVATPVTQWLGGSAVKRRFQDTKHDSNLFSFTFTRLATTLRTVNPILAAPILTAIRPLCPSQFIPTTICLRSELHTRFLLRYPSSSQVSTLLRP